MCNVEKDLCYMSSGRWEVGGRQSVSLCNVEKDLWQSVSLCNVEKDLCYM